MFTKILYLFFFTGFGVAILKYRKNIFEWTGRWYWAEKYIGNGGTVVAIILIGLGLIFFGVGYPFGAFDDLRGDGPLGLSTDGTVTTTKDITGK